MKYRKDPRSGNELSVLGFGCMRFPKTFGSIDMKKTSALINRAIESGINYFDTARIYAGSEEALGSVLAESGLRNKVFLSSKLPSWQIKTRQDIDKIFELTLEKLKTDYIDYYFMHMLSEMDTWERLCGLGIKDWIAEKKRSGQIRSIAFSFHGVREQFINILNAYDWDAVLIQYNYSDPNYQAGVQGLKAACEKGLPVFIMEPLLGGSLVNELPREVKSIFKTARPDWSPAAWGLNWLWDQNEVTMVLSGMNEAGQLEDNLKAAESSGVQSLSAGERAAFDEVRRVFNESQKIKCTGCSYCLPCPKDVNIPGCFSSYNVSFSVDLLHGLWRYGQTVSYTAKTMRNAGRCVGCSKCEQHCPQNLPIRENLKLVKKRLEPFWFWQALSLARKFIKL
ncbi:MAG: aldo/keto reductase [Spirochaetaceae bacterium]|jgi:predicted aldo/keto reductase-like oxidoreductase|nr:aldo/keto reductase [Spirochaetaceae bacterium]